MSQQLCFLCGSTSVLPRYTETCLKTLDVLHNFESFLVKQDSVISSTFDVFIELIKNAHHKTYQSPEFLFCDADFCYNHLKSHTLAWLHMYVADYNGVSSLEFKELMAALEGLPEPKEQTEVPLRSPYAPQKQLYIVIWDDVLCELNKLELSKVYLMLTLINSQTCLSHKFQLRHPEITARDISLSARQCFQSHFAWVARAVLERLGLYDTGIRKANYLKLRQLNMFCDSNEALVQVYMPDELNLTTVARVDKKEALKHEESYIKRTKQKHIRVAMFEQLPFCQIPLSFNLHHMGKCEIINILSLSISPVLLPDVYHYFAVLNFEDPLNPDGYLRLDLARGLDAQQPRVEHLVLLAKNNGLSTAAVCQGLELILRNVFRMSSVANTMIELIAKLPVEPSVSYCLSKDQEDLSRMTVAVSKLQRCPLALDKVIDHCNHQNTMLVEGAFVTVGRSGAVTYNAMNIVKACNSNYVHFPWGWLQTLLWGDTDDPVGHGLDEEDYGRYVMYAKQLTEGSRNTGTVRSGEEDMARI